MNERNLEKLENIMQIVESNDDSIVVFFEKIMEYLKNSQDEQATFLEKVAEAMAESKEEMKAKNKRDFEDAKINATQFMRQQIEIIKSEHYEMLGKISLRLSEIRNGADADEQKIIDEVLKKIPPVKIDLPLPDTPDQLIEKINRGQGLINKDRIEGLRDLAMNIAFSTMSSMPVTTSFFNGLRGKNLFIDGATAYLKGDTVHVNIPAGQGVVQSIVAGTGISVDATDPQNPIVSATGSGGGSLSFETPSGTVDDSNMTFIAANAPIYIIVNGSQLFENVGYTLAGLTITLTNPVGTGGFIRSAFGTGVAFETPSGTINDSNVTFTVANTPKYIVVNGATLFEGVGYSLAGLTITLNAPVGTGGFLRSAF